MLLDKLLQIPLYPLDFFPVLSDILNRSKNTANASPRRAVKFIPRTPGMNLSNEKVCRNEVYNEFKWN